MATTKPITRADLMRQVDEIDAGRVAKIIEILSRPELLAAQEELKSLIDASEADKPLVAGSAAASVNALLKSALVPFNTVPGIAQRMAFDIDARLNPPPAPDPAMLSTAQPAPTS